MAITDYSALVFDCDGVLLDSNRVKTDAFRQTALPFGEAAAQALVDYHVSRGGVSRYAKFRHFLDEIAPQHAPGMGGPDLHKIGLEDLLAAYADAVQTGLMACAVTPGLAELRRATPGIPWLIVSGGDQAELRRVFARRDLDSYFDGGIFGSPDSKDEILGREFASGRLSHPALFLGDSRYDHIAAGRAGLDFVFISGWSEMPAWQDYLATHGLDSVERVADLLNAA